MKRRRIAIGSLDAYGGASGAGTREHRGLRLALGVILGLLVVGYAAGALALHYLLDADEVSAWLGARASAALNRQVTVEAASVSLFPRPRVNVSGVTIANLPAFEGPPLARVERARFGISFLPLFTGRVVVRSLLLDDPAVLLATDAAGVSNFGDLVPQGGAPEPLGTRLPVSLGIEEVEVAGGRLTLLDERMLRTTTLAGVRATGRIGPGADGSWRIGLTGAADSLAWRSPALGDRLFRGDGPSFGLTAELERTYRWLRVVEGSVGFGAARAALEGRIDSIARPTRAIDLRLAAEALDAADVLAALPGEMRARLPAEAAGRISLDLRLNGYAGPDARPRRSGRVELTGFGMLQNGSALAAGVTGKIAVRGDTLVLDQIAGQLLGGPFTLEGELRRQDRAFVLHTSAHPDFDVLDRLGLVPGGASLAGDVQLELTLAGSAEAPEDVLVDGTAALAGLQLGHPRLGVPLYVASGDLELSGNDLTFTDLNVLVGQDPVRVSGRLRRAVALVLPMARGQAELELEARASRLDLDAVLPWTPDEPGETYAQIAFAHLGERRLAGRPPRAVAADHAFARPGTPPLTGRVDLSVDTLEYRRYPMQAVDARILLAGDLLGVTDLSMRLWEGEIAGSLLLGLGTDELQPFALSLAVDSARAADLLAAMTPLDRAVDGVLRLQLDLAGRIDPALLPVAASTSGGGRLEVTDGSFAINPLTGSLADFLAMDAWTRPPFEAWALPFQVADGRLWVQDVELVSELGRIRASGTIDLSGALDLAYGVTIPPERLGDLSLRRTGVSSAVVAGLRRAGQGLSLGFRVGGTVAAPLLEPDSDLSDAAFPEEEGEPRRAPATAEPAAAELREELQQRVQRLLDGLFATEAEAAVS